MGASKTNLFTHRQNEIANLAKALGHPARVTIVEYLLRFETCICGDIVEELPLAQATISQHLRALKGAGIIQGSIEGGSICYCLNPTAIKNLSGFFQNIELKISHQTNQCC